MFNKRIWFGRRYVQLLALTALMIGAVMVTAMLWSSRSNSLSHSRISKGLDAGPGLPLLLQSARATYVENEGNQHRGRNFCRLALLFELERQRGRRLTEHQALETLGPPDLVEYDEADGNYALYAYRYDRFAEKDWVVFLSFRHGELYLSGWNAVSAAGLDAMGPYVPMQR